MLSFSQDVAVKTTILTFSKDIGQEHADQVKTSVIINYEQSWGHLK